MTTTEWHVLLPYDHPPLNLNDRGHWSTRYRASKGLRLTGRIVAQRDRLPKGLAKVRIELHYRPRVRRNRDEDNLTMTLKPLIDGLTDYGLTADDDSRHVTSGVVIHEPGNPALWLVVTECPA